MTQADIRALIAADRLNEAVAAATALIAEASEITDGSDVSGISDGQAMAELYRARGDAHRRLGRIGAAITDYEHALALDPASPAAAALELCRDILDFFSPSQFNP